MVSPDNGSRKRAKKQVNPKRTKPKQHLPHEKEPQYSWWERQQQAFQNNPVQTITIAFNIVSAIVQGIKMLAHLVM